MIINKKIKLNVNSEQSTILDSQSKMCNKMYNALLERVNQERENGSSLELLKGRNLRDETVKVKRLHRYYYSVHSSPLKNSALRLKKSFEMMNSLNTGYPKYRSWTKKWFSLFYDEPKKGIKIKKKSIHISLGYNLDENGKKVRLYVKTTLGERLNLLNSEEIKNYRIIKEHGNYYIIICIEKPSRNKKVDTGKVIAIDPNHTNFFVGIDNEGKSIEFENVYQIKYFDTQIDRLKSKRDICKRKSKKNISLSGDVYYTPSRRYVRLNKALNKLYHKKRVQTKTALYTIANQVVKEYDVIAIGNYVPDADTIIEKRMNRSMLNQSVISKFRRILEHVCEKKGKTFILADESFTTQTCHHCLTKKKISPEIRTYTCPNCGITYHRDINSAINIGVKVNILSSSDYENIDLSNVSYTASYNLYTQTINYCN